MRGKEVPMPRKTDSLGRREYRVRLHPADAAFLRNYCVGLDGEPLCQSIAAGILLLLHRTHPNRHIVASARKPKRRRAG
jgi:hypothetical protein